MVSHLEMLREHISAAGDEDGPIEISTSNQIYGVPNDTVLGLLGQIDAGVSLTVKPLEVAGFTRSAV